MADILLIEPDRLLADTYSSALENENHKVTICTSAQSAIFAADEAKPEIVILELQLIGHSGIEFLYEFRSYPEWQDIPVIILSHVPPREFKGSAQLLREQLNIAAYHYKPHTSLHQLLRSVEQFATIKV